MTTVRELIEFLQKMPQDAIVIQTMMSDYDDIELDQISLIGPDRRMVRHHGHLMVLPENWVPSAPPALGTANPEFLTCVRFPGN